MAVVTVPMMTSPTHSDPVGAPVHTDYRKWDGSPHWQSHGTLLAVDDHGVWVAYPQGTHFERPGAAFDIGQDSVSLFPAAGFTPAFNAPTGRPEQVAVYVDITTPPVWHRTDDGGWHVTMIDLDLDVVQRANGFIYVDDEDEFIDHQRKFGYPSDTVQSAQHDARDVFAAVRDGRGPFDGTGWRWLETMRRPDPTAHR